MSITAAKPATPPLRVHLSATEFTACLFPHLSRPTRGPKGQLGSDRVLHLILWGLDTGLPWKGLPVPQDPPGKPAIHDTTVYQVGATGAEDGSLGPAFSARVAPLSAETHLEISVLHGDGTHPVAKKGGMGVGIRGTNPSRATKSSR
jgi:hypothetical protein